MEHRNGEIKIEENIAFFKAVIYNIYEYVNEDDEDVTTEDASEDGEEEELDF